MNKNFTFDCIVIGAGATGFFLAKKLLKRNLSVIVLEAQKRPGGILRDIKIEEQVFLNGCQYLESISPLIDKTNSSDLHFFEGHLGSSCDIFGAATTSDDFAGPVVESANWNGLLKSFLTRKIANDFKVNDFGSIHERIKGYPEAISRNLSSWLQYIGINTNEISSESLSGLGCSGIYFKGAETFLTELKTENTFIDSLYQIPQFKRGLNLRKCAVPKYGFSNFFSNLRLDLEKKGVQFNLGQTVKPILNEKNIHICCGNGSKLYADHIFWTGNPNPLSKIILNKNLESKTFKALRFHGLIEGNLKYPYYFNIFSISSPFLRIYLYEIAGKCCICADSIPHKLSDGEVIIELERICKRMKVDISIRSLYRNNVISHQFISVADKSNLRELSNNLSQTNAIDCGWHIYNRSKKEDYITKKLNLCLN